MCTVTLSYDENNALARQKLTALLASGLFMQLDKQNDSGIDNNDPWLYEDHGDLPTLPEGKESFTPEEAYDLIMSDIRKIYAEDYAV